MRGRSITSMLGLAIAGLLLAGPTTAFANGDIPETVTFTKDVMPILQSACVECHRPGGSNIGGMVAPMSMMTYEETRPWAKSIEKQISSKTMPPWYASEEFHGIFANERTLTDHQREILIAWVKQGARQGDPADAPPMREFEDTGGWIIGRPDLIVQLPEPYFVKDEVEDEYVAFTVKLTPEMLPEDRWLRAIEWRPDSDVVHHIVGSEIIGDYSNRADADGDSALAGRQGLGSIAPGEEPHIFPPGYGKRLHAGASIYFSMHYHKEPGEGTGKWDQSSVGFRFWDEEKDPPVKHNMIWSGITNGVFEIPPGHKNWPVGAARTFEVETKILSLHPHMHLRGKDAKYTAHYPDGTSEVLLVVPKWDFDWQLDYTYKEPKVVPAGTRIEYTAHFDNSAENEANPDPNIPMGWGGPTTMEMMIGFIHFCDSEPRDFAKAGDVESSQETTSGD